MKRIACLLAMTALLCTGGISAQNQDKGNKPAKKNERSKDTKRQDESNRRFTGTIVYEVTPSKTADKAAPATARKRQNEVGVINKVSPNASLSMTGDTKIKEQPETKEGIEKGSIVYNEEGCFALMGKVGAWCSKEEPMTYLLALPDETFACDADAERWEQIAHASKDFYARTDQTREIAGKKATLYRCKIPGLQGEIWVAEDIVVPERTVPFPGLRHPVLEGEFTLLRGDEPIHAVHIHALELMEQETDESIVKRCRTSIMMPQPEFFVRLQEMLLH